MEITAPFGATEVNWRLEWFAGYDPENAGGVWKLAASGNSRLRAGVVFLIASMAIPHRVLRLRWKAAFPLGSRLSVSDSERVGASTRREE